MEFTDRIGEKKYNTHGTLMKIIEYKNSKNVLIEFQDEHKYRTIVRYGDFKKGEIRNPYDKTILGIGYLGEGKYSKKINRKPYEVWKKMIQRCYDPYELNRRHGYIDCFVCEEWHCFQNFAQWYEKNCYEIGNEKMCLDKDILYKGNKIYSPETCVFVPNKINVLFTKTDAKRGEYPIGVSFLRGKLEVQCCDGNKNKYIGLFKINQVREAWLCYKLNKELVIQSIADEYKDLIPKKLYEALYEYEVEIND